MAALPTTSDTMKKNLLNFAVVGGGPTGIEFSAELHDIIMEDLAKLYPDLIKYHHITVYDVAPTVLNMFDQKLSKYASDRFRREGISIKTSHHVESLRTGTSESEEGHESNSLTLKIKEEGDVGVGMVVWSTGLMMNPFVEKALGGASSLPARGTKFNKSTPAEVQIAQWTIRKDEKTAGIITDDRLRVTLQPKEGDVEHKQQAVLEDVFAIGDCAVMEDTLYPATAQVASQKAEWLAKRLNKGDIEKAGFNYKDLGIMAYVGNWNAIVQSGGANISGRTAWLVWRGAYLTKSVSWRNRILIPVYWVINWAFGRDTSRF
ncbi:hypothetical protein LTR16_000712 [Cryomyces antarcticus]|uniref:FAD/NAD(P)-binding domain-containing protein n=1 Tax=Cryomyces antarcticus TaxID=329879 RepID=A0ABR0M956_9PEZI|nr:hypothetical protein LTR16_000712 [Cryomyces antarcticus]